LGGIGGIILALGQARSSSDDKTEIINTTKNENKELKQQILELKDERATLNDILGTRDKKINQQNSKIESLSNKLIEKSEYIEKYISGGNSYPHIEIKTIINIDEKISKIYFVLKNPYELPIYNIIIEAYDYDEIQSKTFLIGSNNEKAIKTTDLVNSRLIEYKKDILPPKAKDLSLGSFPLKPYSLYIIVQTRNKSLIQKIAFIKFGEQYYSGYVVYDFFEKNIIEESNLDLYSLDIQKLLKEKIKNIQENMVLTLSE
jgi:hypothetical protein